MSDGAIESARSPHKLRVRPLMLGKSEAETLQLMGIRSLLELMDDAALESCPDGVREDWKTVAKWINYSGGEMNQDQRAKIARGWSAYLAFGLAPSIALQENFNHFAKVLRGNEFPLPPKQIINVFDRLLASDDNIQEKHAADIQAERLRMKTVFESATTKQQNWWRALDPKTRAWIFATIVWIMAVFAYSYLFDPFDVGGWDDIGDEEYHRLIAVASLPIFIGLVCHAYRRWVV